MEMILSIVMAIVTIVFVGAIIIAAISFFKKKKDDEPYKIDFKVIFRIYYYIIMFASVVSIGVGLTLTIKSLFSNMFGLDFSYTQQTVYEEVPEKYVEGEEIEYEYEYEKDVDKKDLISGLSYLFVATPILLLHIWGLKQLEKKRWRELFNEKNLSYRLFSCVCSCWNNLSSCRCLSNLAIFLDGTK